MNMKKMLLGLSLIFFGILMSITPMNGLWIPIINRFPFDILGTVAGIVGICFVVQGYRQSEKS